MTNIGERKGKRNDNTAEADSATTLNTLAYRVTRTTLMLEIPET